jgi:hypothetical protein
MTVRYWPFASTLKVRFADASFQRLLAADDFN